MSKNVNSFQRQIKFDGLAIPIRTEQARAVLKNRK